MISRGGRPDLVPKFILSQIVTPSLFIVGGSDYQVLDMNRHAFDSLAAIDKELKVVPGATHLFEESGKSRIFL